jgi:hypothetical protein
MPDYCAHSAAAASRSYPTPTLSSRMKHVAMITFALVAAIAEPAAVPPSRPGRSRAATRQVPQWTC